MCVTLELFPLNKFQSRRLSFNLGACLFTVFFVIDKFLSCTLQGQALDEALNGPMRHRLQQHVLREMHMHHPWYHDDIKRTDAERRVLEGPLPVLDGKFL